MKDYAGMRCPGCGAELGPCEKGKYQCSHCREVFSSDILDGYFCSMYNRTGPSSIREAVAQELDKQLADEIGRNRNVLNQELMKKYPDKEILKNLCLDIEKLWPGEIQATCIRVACSSPTSEELKQVLDSIDVNSFQIYYVDGILDYLFEHVTLKERDLAPISYLIHRAYENKDSEMHAIAKSTKKKRMRSAKIDLTVCVNGMCLLLMQQRIGKWLLICFKGWRGADTSVFLPKEI